jgi:hypothetical protein
MKPASGLLALTFHLAIVSSISFGGFPTVLPDVRAFCPVRLLPPPRPSRRRARCISLRFA